MGNVFGGQENGTSEFIVDSLYAMCKNASQAEIKSAFKKGALVHHPDNGGDSEQFRQLCDAYRSLMDPVKRSRYERGGGLDISQMSADDIFAWLDTEEEESGAPTDPASDQDHKMTPYHVDLWVDESVAMRGTRLQREVRRQVNKSKGRVARPSPQCRLCSGTGKVTKIIRTKLAAARITESCSCVPKLTENTRCITDQVVFDVPFGAKEGQEIRIPNKGNECMGFSAGDLIFTVRLETRSGRPNIKGSVPQAQSTPETGTRSENDSQVETTTKTDKRSKATHSKEEPGPYKPPPGPYIPPRDQDSSFGLKATHSTEAPGRYMPPRDRDGNLIYNCAPLSVDDR